MKARNEIEIRQEKLLDKYFSCSKKEEEQCIKDLDSISKTLSININSHKKRDLDWQYNNNRAVMRGSVMKFDHPFLYQLLFFGLGLSVIMAISLWTGISTGGLGFLIFTAIGLAVGTGFLISAIIYKGIYAYDKYKQEETNQNFNSFDSDFDRKFTALINSNQFDHIDCQHLHFYKPENHRDTLHNLYGALYKNKNIILSLPDKDQISMKKIKKDMFRINLPHNDQFDQQIEEYRKRISEKSQRNEIQNKHRLFFHGNSGFLSELRNLIFQIIKRLYFPNQTFTLNIEPRKENRKLTKQY